MTNLRPTIAVIQAAAERLSGHAILTPLLESPLLNETLGGRLLVKPECLQLTGSFKFRGAYNKISQMDEEQRRRGVIAYSSGERWLRCLYFRSPNDLVRFRFPSTLPSVMTLPAFSILSISS